MNYTYLLIMIITVVTVSVGIINLILSILYFSFNFKNSHCDIKENIKKRRVDILLNLDVRDEEIFDELNLLLSLNYSNKKIDLIGSVDSNNLINKIIEKYSLHMVKTHFKYVLNKDEIFSMYENDYIRLFVKEKDSKWNYFNALIDNINFDLFIIKEKDVSLTYDALNILEDAFEKDDNIKITFSNVVNEININEENGRIKGLSSFNLEKFILYYKNIFYNFYSLLFYKFTKNTLLLNSHIFMINSSIIKNTGFSEQSNNPLNEIINNGLEEKNSIYVNNYLAIRENSNIKENIGRSARTMSREIKEVVKKSQGISFVKGMYFINMKFCCIFKIPLLIILFVLMGIGILSFDFFFFFIIIYLAFSILVDEIIIMSSSNKSLNLGVHNKFIIFLYTFFYSFLVKQIVDIWTLIEGAKK